MSGGWDTYTYIHTYIHTYILHTYMHAAGREVVGMRGSSRGRAEGPPTCARTKSSWISTAGTEGPFPRCFCSALLYAARLLHPQQQLCACPTTVMWCGAVGRQRADESWRKHPSHRQDRTGRQRVWSTCRVDIHTTPYSTLGLLLLLLLLLHCSIIPGRYIQYVEVGDVSMTFRIVN